MDRHGHKVTTLPRHNVTSKNSLQFPPQADQPPADTVYSLRLLMHFLPVTLCLCDLVT